MDQGSQHQILQDWKQGIERFVVQDVRASLDRDFLEVGLIILTLVGIDCIGGYFAGMPAQRTTFRQFITSRYFPEDYYNIAEELYELRNGLVHDYTIKFDRFHFFRNVSDGYPHLREVVTQKGSQITLNREIFARDFVSAWENYSSDVFVTEELATKAMARIGEQGRGFLVVGEIQTQSGPKEHVNQNSTQYGGGTVNYPQP
jgi:hypothetical protein